jgi:hypothetical protein
MGAVSLAAITTTPTTPIAAPIDAQPDVHKLRAAPHHPQSQAPATRGRPTDATFA